MATIKFNEFVENNFNANRVEELRNGTSILTGFKNLQESLKTMKLLSRLRNSKMARR